MCLIVLTILASRPLSKTGLIVYAAGTPDVYGNKIREFRVQQYNGTDWNTVSTLTNTTYSSGVEIALDPVNTRFYIRIYFNTTLAVSQTQAKTRIKVNMTITGVSGWTDNSIVGTDYNELQYVGLEGDFWIFESGVYTEWADGPEEGEYYNTYVTYQVYA